jgi:hypothetical protein
MKVLRFFSCAGQFLGRSLVFIIVFTLVLNIALTLIVSPVYDFPEPRSFSGDRWYNPYAHVDGAQWKLSNFQVQSRAWGGVTNGMNNPAERVFATYDSLGYDLITISDYMSINPYHSLHKAYVPVYEHGYGIRKTHQVCIGADEVLALDYPLLQTRNTKQFILNRLAAGSDLVAIAHPSVRNAYTLKDMEYLSGYDLIEALSNFQHSIAHWDVALTAGHPVFLLANDDAHNLDNPFDYGKVATVFHSSSLATDSVVKALKAGSAYGITIHCPDYENHDHKIERFKDLPQLTALTLENDQMQIIADRKFSEVRFIGDNGQLVHTAAAGDTASFLLPDTVTYVRAELDFTPGHTIYTNPVLRSVDGKKPAIAQASINWPATILYRAFFFIVVAIGVLLIFVRNSKYLIPRWQPLPQRRPSA